MTKAEGATGLGTRVRLDPEQRCAVEHGAGPVLVAGGPGTGKSTVLEERFLRLATQPGCSSDRILFLVPNRAQKMALQDRVTRRLFERGLEAVIEVPVYTWHGFANHLVTRHYDRLAYPDPPVLLTSPEQWGDVKEALAAPGEELRWSKAYRHLLTNRGFVDEVVDFFIRAEQRLLFLEPEDLDRLIEMRPAWADIVRFFKEHREQLRRRSRIDYPTLLADATDLIANHDDVRAALHQRFTHVLVDDGQELARVQQRLLRFLTGFVDSAAGAGERSLAVAADPDSAIETFRGAEPEWLHRFEKEFGSHEPVILRTSYRLGSELGRRGVGFIAQNGEAGHRPTDFRGRTVLEARNFQNLSAEMEDVARAFRLAHLQDQVPYEEMAILLTSPRGMLPALERALNALEVPYSIAAPDRPLEREPVVRAFIELARLSHEKEPDPERVADLLRTPLIGLESQQVRELERTARERAVSLIDLVAELPERVDPQVREAIATMLQLMQMLRESRDEAADAAFWRVWETAPYYRQLVAQARTSLQDPANRELDALVAFSRSLGRFVERRRGRGTLDEYLHAIGRADFGSDPWLPPERRGGGVEVLSFHAAKGKEWELVAVSGCVEGAIPKGRRAQGLFDPYFLDNLTATERQACNDAEDRRVFYVATTRARSRCIVTTSPGATRKGQPSRFVAELTGELPAIGRERDLPPLTFAEAAAAHRKVLADVRQPAAERIAAGRSIARICKLDPGCSAAKPSEWWWRWDWTEGSIAINEQRQGSDNELPSDKLRTSYSRISEYDNCGLKYLFQVVLGFDPETSHNMAFGSWIHKIFEECDKHLITTQTGAHQRFEELFDESVFPNKAIARQFRHDGKVMIDRYATLMDPGGALLVERPFKIEFHGHVITGRIDRVDRFGNGVQVTDYKTSRRPIWYDEARESLQLAIYYLAAQKDEEIARHGPPLGMRLLYPAHLSYDKPTARCQKPEEADVALQRLPALIDGVLAEDFRPSPEADCMWCKFKPLCPLWAEGKELPA